MTFALLAGLGAYLKRRLAERSTWAAIVAGISGGALLPAPYSWLAIGAAITGALLPGPAAAGAAPEPR